jgi:beta-lactamase class D
MRHTTEIIPVASAESWTLYERTGKAGSDWRSLKLIRTGGRGRKRNWWLGWNGERLARCHDAENLAEHNPEILQWVIDSLKAAD